ncbi:hypothetical protein CLV98_111137 [Dyadobacter jejuensis]|uniref:Small multi-drug export protein n=1 Tax=Dyadobacter jejuensis TaxID=1082580 RepID=A0A316AG10_9BACT|nr:hypothetical protein [Dyadobacter jejuensis]PWJ56643.1 hypothetical protein CLV98_111137 [Dyadobacter jejuensis]
MKSEIVKYLSVAFASALKFFGGPITGVVLELNWIETALASATGMMAMVFLLTYVGKWIQQFIERYRKAPNKRFTKSNRMAVRIWKKFGIIGIAFLTPPLFTPIFGPLLAVGFKVPKNAIFLWMTISAILWGFGISFIAHKMTYFQNWIR